MLALESTKKYKANIIRQFAKGRCVFQTHVVCVTDKMRISCQVGAHIQGDQKETKDNKYYIEKEGRNLNHGENC